MVSDNERKNIIRLYKSGLNYAQVSKITGRSYPTIKAITEAAGMSTRQYQKNSTDKFASLCPESAYWLGFIAADGYLSVKYGKLVVEINDRDEEHLDSLISFIGFGNKFRRHTPGREGMVTFAFYSKELAENISKWINPEAKTELDNFSNIPDDLRIPFVRGYFDGDGHRWKWQMKFTGCPGTLGPLTDYVCEVLDCNVRVVPNGDKAFDYHFTADAQRAFVETFNGMPRLERKWY